MRFTNVLLLLLLLLPRHLLTSINTVKSSTSPADDDDHDTCDDSDHDKSTDSEHCYDYHIYNHETTNSATAQCLLHRSRSFNVTDLSTNREPVCDFLLQNITNLHPISYRCQMPAPRKSFDILALYKSDYYYYYYRAVLISTFASFCRPNLSNL